MIIPLPPELATLDIRPPWVDDCPYQRMVYTEIGECYPLLSIPGYGIYNSYKRHMLCIGTRKATKSVAIANKVMRHLWEIDGAVVAVVCRSIKNAKIGVWRDLVNFVMPGWMESCGLEIVKQGTDAVSKMEYVRVKNMHGTISEVQLHSCDYAFAAETKFKGARFSMVWLSEADQFEDRCVFDILSDQLRVIGVSYEKHQIIADCNWPEDGADNFLHCIFEDSKNPESKYYRDNYHEEFEIRVLSLFENPFLDPREKDDLKRKYQHDPVRYKRFVENPDREWVKDATAGLFSDNFHFNIHVLGTADGVDKSKWEVITPPKNARVLLSGTDCGSLNNATGLWVPYTDERGEVCYSCFDEIVAVDKPISIRQFAKDVWSRIEFWNAWMMKTYGMTEPPIWRHWADSSLWNYNSGSNSNDTAIFYEVSGGKMPMRAVTKGRDSVRQRIELFNRLFFDNRAFISAHCRWAIAWARHLKPGRAKNQPVSQATMKFKHKFDADSYCVGMELANELFQDDTPSVATGIITT